MAATSLVAILCLTVLAVQSAWSSNVDFKNPVRSAGDDLISDLPGLGYDPKFKQYSGYLAADNKQNRFWHYWLVESQSDPANDPLVLWLNGGPGCSSLLGLLTELGPFRIENDTIKPNPFAWNKNANVLFMESPAGVGFSYAVDNDLKADDDTTAAQNHRALRSFLEKFPQYKNSPLYLTGESYAGVYLPTLAVLVDRDPKMNLKGVAIGNGYLDAGRLSESLIFFSYYHGLVGRHTWDGLSKYCCGGKPPAKGQCRFTDPNRSKNCAQYVNDATDQIIESGLNPYNLYDRCAGSGSSTDQVFGREQCDKHLMLSAFNSNATATRNRSKGGRQLFSPFNHKLRSDPPCTDDSIVINYLNKPESRAALHIPDDLKTPFTTCSDSVLYTMIYPILKDGLAPQMRSLMNSNRNLTLVVYNGDIDLMCNAIGDEWFVDDLGREVKRDYRPWYVDRQVAGFVKVFDKITFMTVKGSGHMVPTDKAPEALTMFEEYVLQKRASSNGL